MADLVAACNFYACIALGHMERCHITAVFSWVFHSLLNQDVGQMAMVYLIWCAL